MPLFKVIHNQDNIIGIWRLDEDENQLLEQLSNRYIYENSLESIKSSTRRREWLCTRVLLNTLCNGNEEIDYLKSGAPYLKSDTYNISISHTKGYVAVILNKSKSVAIDIEFFGERIRKVVSRFVRHDEKINIYNNSDLWSLLLHWSAKESAFKILQEDNVDFLEHLQIIPFNVLNEGCFVLNEYRTGNKEHLNIHYILFEDFVLTYCCK